jgi:hypothetical protein
MSKCTNPKLGDLLHVYELNALSEEDIERFEIHLLECEYCFEQLKSFERQANLLASDEEVKELIRESTMEEYAQPESFLKKLWRYIWPETPLLFKPALAYLLILLLILPAYYGLRKVTETGTETEIGPVQNISLTPLRSMGEDVFKISLGKDGLINFVFEGAITGKSYQVIIKSIDGKVVYQDDAFKEFDEYRMGRLLLPLNKMKMGDYQLIITDPQREPPLNRQEYSFRIEK